MGSIRTFIAFDTPEPIKEAMRVLQFDLRNSGADVRWEPVEKFHTTIKFLGSVEDRMQPAVRQEVEQTVTRFSLFDVVFHSLGAFPDKRHPRVIWIGCESGSGHLLRLKEALDSALAPHGYPVEERTFHTHITLGRVKGERGMKNLLSKLENLTFEPHTARVERILLMKSTLGPHGSEYSILTSIPLT
jgi:2'-5' RNA ligase